LRGVSKDGRKHRVCGHPSRLALKKGEHLRMTAVLVLPSTELVALYFTRAINSIAPAGARTLPSWMT
jgi:hypothetical protein